MKVKTSVTIEAGLLRAIDKAGRGKMSRSSFFEQAARESLARRERSAREARDLEILNAASDDLNQEMDDVLSYQDFP